MYKVFFRLVLARMDPEKAHHGALWVLRAVSMVGFGRCLRRRTRPHPALAVNALGLRFPSPFGVAAGFDKDGVVIAALGELGFGHVEVGTVTALPQSGNPKPRVFRLALDHALINRLGFNNRGAEELARRLRSVRELKARPIVGVNIGKSRVVDVEHAVDDYRASARVVAPLADYLAVNVSSPNTPGLRGLQDNDALAPLLRGVKEVAGDTPLLVKIAPDLTNDQIDEIARLAVSLGLDGIIATNTTVDRGGLWAPHDSLDAIGPGGLSGKPLARRSCEVLARIRSVVPSDMCVISVGGVTTARDVAERLRAGATLVQGYTAFVYEGPLWARSINRGLYRLWRAGKFSP